MGRRIRVASPAARRIHRPIALDAGLTGMGIGRGDKVALLMPNGYRTAILFLGVMYTGRTVAPLNLQAQPVHLHYVLEHADARLVYVDRTEGERLSAALEPIDRPIAVVPIDIDEPEAESPEPLPDAVLPAVGPEDDPLLLCTSGTTGHAQGGGAQPPQPGGRR